MMENQRSIQSANFDLVNTYFGKYIRHPYDRIDVTARMPDTLSAQQDRPMHVYDLKLLNILICTVDATYMIK